MIQTITKSMFRDAFQHTGRGDTFSYSGLGVIFDHLEEMDSSLELDVISICCDFQEGSLTDILSEYGLETLEQLQDRTMVLEVDSETIIIQVF